MDGLRSQAGYAIMALALAALLVNRTGPSSPDAGAGPAPAAEPSAAADADATDPCAGGRTQLEEYRTLYGPLAFRTVVALVPDPEESRHTESFDQVVQGVEEAIAEGRDGVRYVRDRHWLPWSGTDEARKKLRCWEKEPGVILFRPRRDAGHERPFAVLVVGETPTWGLRTAQFEQALALADEFGTARHHTILGPASSGTAASLSAALRTYLENGTARVTVVSGTSTDPGVEQTVEAAGAGVTYSAAAANHVSLLRGMKSFLLDRGGRCDDLDGRGNIVLFTESLTTYGSQASPTCFKRRAFPPNLASIRRAYESVQGGGTSLAPVPRAPLGKEAGGTPVSNDLVLGEMLRDIGGTRVRYVGIVATDARDVVFMADRIRRQLPDVRLFTVRAHPLYLHPSHARTLNGMLVAHSTPRAREELHSTSLGMEIVYDVYRAGRALLEEKPVSRAAVQVSFIGNGHMWRVGLDPARATPRVPVLWWFTLFTAMVVACAVALLVFVVPRFVPRRGTTWLMLVGRCEYRDLDAEDRCVTAALLAVIVCPALLMLISLVARDGAETSIAGTLVSIGATLATVAVAWASRLRRAPVAPGKGTMLLTGSATAAAVLALGLACGPQSEATFNLFSGGSPLLAGLIGMGSFALALACARVRLRQLDAHCFAAGQEETFAKMPPPIAMALGEYPDDRSGLAAAELAVLNVLRNPWTGRHASVAIAVHALLAASIAVLFALKPPCTLEAGWRGWVLVAFGGLAMLPATGNLARLLATWFAFRRFLRRLAGTPAANALGRLAPQAVRPLQAQLAGTGLHVSDLAHPVNVLARLARLSPQMQKAHRECVDLLNGELSDECGQPSAACARTKLARQLLEIAGKATESRAQFGPKAREAIDDLGAALLAVFIPRYVRHFRLFAPPLLVCSVLSVFMTSLYFVQPQRLIASIIFVWVVAIAGAVAAVYLGLDRDPVIRSMCRPRAGEVTMNWAVFRRFLSWGALPVTGFLAAQFPEFAFWVSSALESIAKGLR